MKSSGTRVLEVTGIGISSGMISVWQRICSWEGSNEAFVWEKSRQVEDS